VNTVTAGEVLALVRDLCAPPALSAEEQAAWLDDLCGPLRITFEEATTVLSDQGRRGLVCRRPGQAVAAVQALRRCRLQDDPIVSGAELSVVVDRLRTRILEPRL
jgi:hypothetical protein